MYSFGNFSAFFLWSPLWNYEKSSLKELKFCQVSENPKSISVFSIWYSLCQTVAGTSMICQFNDFLNLIFGGLLTFRPTVRRAIASHFFSQWRLSKNCWSVSWMLFSYSLTWCNISNAFFPPTFIEYELRFQSGDGKILPLIKQKCIEPSTNMKQVRYGFCLHEINRWIALILQTCSDILS